MFGATTDQKLMPEKQRFGNDGTNTTGAHKSGEGDDQLNREDKQYAHVEGKLPRLPFGARLLTEGTSRYDSGIRTPQVTARVR